MSKLNYKPTEPGMPLLHVCMCACVHVCSSCDFLINLVYRAQAPTRMPSILCIYSMYAVLYTIIVCVCV